VRETAEENSCILASNAVSLGE